MGGHGGHGGLAFRLGVWRAAQSGANWTEETKQNFKSYSEAVSSPAAGRAPRRQPFAGSILRPEKEYLWFKQIQEECNIQTMEKYIKMGQQLVTDRDRRLLRVSSGHVPRS